ncbi:MAG: cold-shock protein [Burkholderiales bacterium]
MVAGRPQARASPTNRPSLAACRQLAAKQVLSARVPRGFIQPYADGKDVFVHISAVEKAGFSGLAEATKISYDATSAKSRP